MRVGVVGLGFGATVHVPALRRVDGVEVVAVAGTSETHAADVCRKLGVPNACGSVAALLEHELDAVTVAVPPDRQAEVLRTILRRGLPVLAEKPLAATVVEADELTRLANGLTTAVDFEFGELRTFAALKDAVAEADVRSVQVEWRTRSRAHVRREWSWKRDRGRGGGVLALLGSHVLFLLEWLFGPFTLLAAEAGSSEGAPHGVDAAHVAPSRMAVRGHVREHVPVSVVLDNDSSEQRHEWRVELAHSTLTATNVGIDPAQGFELQEVSGANGHVVSLVREPRDADQDGRIAPVAAVARRFVAAAAAGVPTHPTFAAGLRVQHLMAAAEDASARRMPVEVVDS